MTACSCTEVHVMELTAATDEPCTTILQMIDSGWRYDDKLLTFRWSYECAQHLEGTWQT